MARGFLSGAVIGGVVSVAVAGAASLLSGDLAVPTVSDAAPDAARAPTTGEAVETAAPKDSDVVQDGASAVSTPTADTVDSVAQAGADVPLTPEAGAVQGLDVPAGATDNGVVSVDSEAPVLPSPQAQLPEASEREELSISTDPAQPPAPTVPEVDTAFEADEAPDATQAPAQPVAPDVTDGTSAQQEPPVEEEVAALPEVEAPQDEGPQDEGRPAIGRPAGTLIDRSNDAAPAEPEVTPTDQAALPPLEAFAVPFERNPDKPAMAIVLLDQGINLDDGPVGLAALRSFPYPLSFAVDATLSDAAVRMADYRAQGFEVLAVVDLPTGATATDAEVTLGAALKAVPEAVAVLEGVENGLQEDREASDQITQILAASGHGFVLQSKGLNTVQKLAEREGVPSAIVFRDFDSADQSPTVIRRFLDQAAFRAGQEGGVIMMGRLRADTISALILWGLQDRAERVDLTPVSALLRAQDG